MAISPAELQSRVNRHTAAEASERLLAGWFESYAELWREREELRERLARLESELERTGAPSSRRPPRRRPRALAAVAHVLFATVAALALAAFVLMFAIMSGLYELDPETGRAMPRPPSSAAAPATAGSAAVESEAGERSGLETERAALATRPEMLRLTAAHGESWIQVLRGSPNGEVLYEGVLGAGQVESFSGERFVLRLGAPANLEAEFADQPLELPTSTADVVVHDGGLRILSVG